MLDLIGQLRTALGQIVVRSGVNPFLWLCLLAALTFLPAAAFLTDFSALLVGTVVLVFAVTLLTCVGCAVFRPDLLRSEQHQIQQQALGIFQQGPQGTIIVSEKGIEAMPNPGPEFLAPPEEEGPTNV